MPSKPSQRRRKSPPSDTPISDRMQRDTAEFARLASTLGPADRQFTLGTMAVLAEYGVEGLIKRCEQTIAGFVGTRKAAVR